MSTALLYFPGAAAVTGVVSHLCYFTHGEHHVSGPQILLTIFFAPTVFFLVLQNIIGISAYDTTRLTTALTLSYVFALFASILVYRDFFHPL